MPSTITPGTSSFLDRSSSVTQSARRWVATATLTTSARVAFIERIRSSRSAGRLVEIVPREHDPLSVRALQQVVESGAGFHIDVFGAGRQRVAQESMALFLRTGERSTFPCRPARDDDRTPAPCKGRGDVRIDHRIEPQLHEVGAAHRQHSRRHAAGPGPPSSSPSRSRTVAASSSYTKKASSTSSAEEAEHLLVARWRSGQDGCLFRTGLSKGGPIQPPREHGHTHRGCFGCAPKADVCWTCG